MPGITRLSRRQESCTTQPSNKHGHVRFIYTEHTQSLSKEFRCSLDVVIRSSHPKRSGLPRIPKGGDLRGIVARFPLFESLALRLDF